MGKRRWKSEDSEALARHIETGGNVNTFARCHGWTVATVQKKIAAAGLSVRRFGVGDFAKASGFNQRLLKRIRDALGQNWGDGWYAISEDDQKSALELLSRLQRKFRGHYLRKDEIEGEAAAMRQERDGYGKE